MRQQKEQQSKRLAVVGGGAAGLACAIAAGERAQTLGVPIDIVVFERDDRVGRSILATGNGRCNFSNARIDPAVYRNAAFVGEVFDACAQLEGGNFAASDMLAATDAALRNAAFVARFFERRGLAWREEIDGRRLPLANKASVVLDVLRAAAANVGVREACEREVRAVEAPRAPGKPFTLRMADGVFERADAVVVACGGRALEALEIEGLRKLPMNPVLGPLRVADSDIPLVRELDNIRVRCAVSLVRGAPANRELVARESGELMFRKYGVSGICVFNLSRFAQPGDVLLVNFLAAEGSGPSGLASESTRLREFAPEGSDLGESVAMATRPSGLAAEGVPTNEPVAGEAGPGEPAAQATHPGEPAAQVTHPDELAAATAVLQRRRAMLAEHFGERLSYADMLRGMLLPRVYETLLKTVGAKPTDTFAGDDISRLANLLTAFPLEVKGIGDPDICQVRRGGLDATCFDSATMEAREAPGLYAVGEALDVDGPCGGFNLHWAWSSGVLAGVSAADGLRR